MPCTAKKFEASRPEPAGDADPHGSTLSWSEAAGNFSLPVVSLPLRDLHRRLPQLRWE